MGGFLTLAAAVETAAPEITVLPEPAVVPESTAPQDLIAASGQQNWLLDSFQLPNWSILAAAGVVLLIVLCMIYLARRRGKAGKTVFFGENAPKIGKIHGQGKRGSQQDSFSVTPNQHYATHGVLAVVADGMGGLEEGDQVSQCVVAAMTGAFPETQDSSAEAALYQMLYAANGHVNNLLGYDRIGQCGSTVAAGLVKDGQFSFLSVGDSRICLYREGRLMQLNREHNYRRELELRVINGEGTLEEANNHPKSSGLTSYLGMGQLKYIDLPNAPIPVRAGDCFVLMTDGVYNALTDAEICTALAHPDPQAAADALGAAVEGKNWPGQDNYTAVILRC